MSAESVHEFETGAVRSGDRDDVRYDLISPLAMERLAKTYAEGANKRGAHNWENGMPVSDLLNHALAHIYAFLGGDRSEDHIAHAIWNLMAVIHSLALWPHLNEGWLRGPGCTCPENAQIKKQPGEKIANAPTVAEGVAQALALLQKATS
jgi:hypothetical protein